MSLTIYDEMEFYEILQKLQMLTNEKAWLLQCWKPNGLSLSDFTSNQQRFACAYARGMAVGAKIGQERGNQIMRLFNEQLRIKKQC